MMILTVVYYDKKTRENSSIKFSVYGEDSAKEIVKMLRKNGLKIISADLAITWQT